MPKNHQEIVNQKEEEKQATNNYKFKLNKINMNKISKKENIASISNDNNTRLNNINDNINLNKNSYKQEINQNINNNINNNLEPNIDYNNSNDINNENMIDSETYIVDNEDNIEKPPNALEINDLIGEKCELDLDKM